MACHCRSGAPFYPPPDAAARTTPPKPEDPPLRIVAATDDVGEARSWEVLLSAVTVPHRVVDRFDEALPYEDTDYDERFCLVVSREDADRARALVDVDREEASKRAEQRALAAVAALAPRATRLIGGVAALALSALLVAVYLRSPGFDSPLSRLLRVDGERVLNGEWQRLLGAAFLHADAGHLFSNIGFLLPLGLFCVERLGVGHFLFAFAWTAALGNAASVLWHGGHHISVGASGGVFGVLGTLVGAAIAETGLAVDPVRRRRELIGAGLAFLGMTAFAEKSDMAAHVFGCLAGVVFGAAAARWSKAPAVDTLFGVVAIGASVVVFVTARG